MEEQATSRILTSIDAAEAAGVRRSVIFMVAPFRVEVELREGKRNSIAVYSTTGEIFYKRRGNASGLTAANVNRHADLIFWPVHVRLPLFDHIGTRLCRILLFTPPKITLADFGKVTDCAICLRRCGDIAWLEDRCAAKDLPPMQIAVKQSASVFLLMQGATRAKGPVWYRQYIPVAGKSS
jgi:hypothetical protein